MSLTEIRVRLHELKGEFDQIHQKAMASLEARDFEGLAKAIAHEREILLERARLLGEANPRVATEPDQQGPKSA